MRQFIVVALLLVLILFTVGCTNDEPFIAEDLLLREVPVKWLDSHRMFEEGASWEDRFELELSEFPGVTFVGSSSLVTANDQNGSSILFYGMPIGCVYLADITGDGLPDFVATASTGSGLVWGHIIVYDFANGELYKHSEMLAFHGLLIESENLIVTRNDEPIGELAIIDGALTIIYF